MIRVRRGDRSAPGRSVERSHLSHGKIGYVQIGMLGPFEVRIDDGAVAQVPGARLRGLLIALALEPGRVGERPPPHGL